MSRFVRGVPRDLALYLRDEYHLDTFIETGTLIGYSAKWASSHFNRVFTVEFFDDYYKLAVNNLACCPNVTCIKNLSIYALEELRQLYDGTCFPLFWLDAHWVEEARYGRPEQDTDVANEIAFVNLWNSQHAIIVDDAHKFSTKGWPELEYVIYLLDDYGRRTVYKAYDMLVAVPLNITIQGNFNDAESIDASVYTRLS